MGCCNSIPPHQSVFDEIREIQHTDLKEKYYNNNIEYLETINNTSQTNHLQQIN